MEGSGPANNRHLLRDLGTVTTPLVSVASKQKIETSKLN